MSDSTRAELFAALRDLSEIVPELWPLVLFLAVAMTIGVKRYRQTLD